MYKLNNSNERGQSLVLVALLMIAFIGMLALALDGGFGFYQRRIAQNAADAGALAGARELCEGNGQVVAFDTAQEYVGRNDAGVLDISFPGTRRIRVETEITFPTFFARVLGHEEMTAVAAAEAGCFSPTYGEGVLPVVWNCQPPVAGWDSNSTSCQQQRIDWDTLQAYLLEPEVVHPELYVVMDNESYDTDFFCVEEDPAGTLICDLDGDGEIDWLASGGRSWVDLDGKVDTPDYTFNCVPLSGEGSGELSYWISNGYPCELTTHTWIPEETGVSTNIFDAAYDRWRNGNPLVIVPVFDDYCPGIPKPGEKMYNSACAGKWHPEDLLRPNFATGKNHFHITGFAAFYITCVRTAQNKPPDQICPGIEMAVELNKDNNKILNGNSHKSIEGYFIGGYIPGMGGIGDSELDTGIYTLFLTH